MHQEHRSQRKYHPGFTLLELMIVIATILVLASIIFPIARAAIESANRSACVSNMHQIAQLVEAYRQDYAGYPPLSGTIGLRGIPQVSISALALTNAGLTGKDFWCPLDPYESRFAKGTQPAPQRDTAGSTYSYGYNYYGLVTTTDGLPYAISGEEAARFLFDDGNPNWDLDLVDQKTDSAGNTFFRPRGLFQGLWNVQAPPDTIVTFCLNHPANKPRTVPVVMASGAAMIIRPQVPADDQKTYLFASGPVRRQPDGTPRIPPIDWRINKAPFTTNNRYENEYYGDSAGNEGASLLPIVETYYRNIDVEKEMRAPIAADGAAWYETGLDCQDGDIIMIRANAKWNYHIKSKVTDRSFWATQPNGQDYAALFSEQGAIYFNADGNPVEVKHNTYPATMVLPDQPHCLLIGKIGDTGTIFPIGSSGCYRVKAGETGTLRLSLNDTQMDYNDNNGWCEVWFGFYRPVP